VDAFIKIPVHLVVAKGKRTLVEAPALGLTACLDQSLSTVIVFHVGGKQICLMLSPCSWLLCDRVAENPEMDVPLCLSSNQGSDEMVLFL